MSQKLAFPLSFFSFLCLSFLCLVGQLAAAEPVLLPAEVGEQEACLRGAIRLGLPSGVTLTDEGTVWVDLPICWEKQARLPGGTLVSVTFYRLTLASETLVCLDDQGKCWRCATDSPRTIFPEPDQSQRTIRVKLRREEPIEEVPPAGCVLPHFVQVSASCELLIGWAAAPLVFSDVMASRLGPKEDYLERWRGDDFQVTLIEVSCQDTELCLRAEVSFREAADFFDSHLQRPAALNAYLLETDAELRVPYVPQRVRPERQSDTGVELEYLFSLPEGKRNWNFIMEIPMRLSVVSLVLCTPDD